MEYGWFLDINFLLDADMKSYMSLDAWEVYHAHRYKPLVELTL